METYEYYSIIGISTNIVGAIILAISLNSIIKAYNLSFTALEHFKESFVSGKNLVSFIGLDKHRKKALVKNKILIVVGLIMLVVGFLLQLISIAKEANN